MCMRVNEREGEREREDIRDKRWEDFEDGVVEKGLYIRSSKRHILI